MSETKTQAKTKIAAVTCFSHRNIKKEFTKFVGTPTITKNAHLELGEHNETKIVEDRNDDWFELQQRDVDKVGLANILDLARKQGINAYDGRYSFKDGEAMDLSDMNPNDPESIKSTIDAGTAAMAELKATAEKLGVSVSDLITAAAQGTLASLVGKKEETVSETVTEGE